MFCLQHLCPACKPKVSCAAGGLRAYTSLQQRAAIASSTAQKTITTAKPMHFCDLHYLQGGVWWRKHAHLFLAVGRFAPFCACSSTGKAWRALLGCPCAPNLHCVPPHQKQRKYTHTLLQAASKVICSYTCSLLGAQQKPLTFVSSQSHLQVSTG